VTSSRPGPLGGALCRRAHSRNGSSPGSNPGELISRLRVEVLLWSADAPLGECYPPNSPRLQTSVRIVGRFKTTIHSEFRKALPQDGRVPATLPRNSPGSGWRKPRGIASTHGVATRASAIQQAGQSKKGVSGPKSAGRCSHRSPDRGRAQTCNRMPARYTSQTCAPAMART
jgi:hypothetical protein